MVKFPSLLKASYDPECIESNLGVGNDPTLNLGNDLTPEVGNHVTLTMGNQLDLKPSTVGNIRDPRHTIARLVEQGTKSLFLSLEMDAEGITTELLCRRAGVDNTTLRRPLDTDTMAKLQIAKEEISSGQIVVDCSPYLTTTQVYSKVAAAARRGVHVVFLDYLQRMNFQLRDHKDMNYATVVALTVNRLADIAKECNVALIFLSQLANRAEGQPATIADLKDSGGIAEGVDCIILLNNEDRIHRNYLPNTRTNQVCLTVEQRQGPSGQTKCHVDLGRALYVQLAATDKIKPQEQSDADWVR